MEPAEDYGLAMLEVSVETVRLFLHVLAATVWVGGQITLVALLPLLRADPGDLAKRAANAYNRIAWPAFAVLLATGVWNLVDIDVGDTSSAYQVTLGLKLVLVTATGLGALLHTKATTKIGLAVWGAIGGTAAIGALFVGVMLAAGG